MHINFAALSLWLLSSSELALARPTSSGLSRRNVAAAGEAAAPPPQSSCTLPPAASAEQQAGAGAEGEKKNEVEIPSTFGTAVAVKGDDLKQDLVFTKSTVGKFEYEFQSKTADEVTVTENTTPGAPPAGFEAIEKSSYVVSLAQSKGAGLTLSKIDYIFDPASAELAGKDITKAQVGRLCPETGAFVISSTLGEVEFERDENEVTLNLNKNVTAQGEWGIFLPVAAAAAEAAPGSETVPKAEGAPKTGEEKAGEGKAEAAPKGEMSPKAEAAPKGGKAPKAETAPKAEAAPKQEAAPEAESAPKAEAAPKHEGAATAGGAGQTEGATRGATGEAGKAYAR